MTTPMNKTVDITEGIAMVNSLFVASMCGEEEHKLVSGILSMTLQEEFGVLGAETVFVRLQVIDETQE